MGGHPKLVFVVEFILFCEDNVCVYNIAVSLYHVCSSSYLNISPSFLICITPLLYLWKGSNCFSGSFQTVLHFTKCFPKMHLLEEPCALSPQNVSLPTLGYQFTPQALAFAVRATCILVGYVFCFHTESSLTTGRRCCLLSFSLKAQHRPCTHGCWLWIPSFS